MNKKIILVKTKLVILILVSILSLSALIGIISIANLKDSIINNKYDQLSSIKISKKSEIENYLQSIEGLLVSLASHSGTKNSFLELKNGFDSFQSELNLDINTIKSKLKTDFELNYLSNVNYNILNSEHKKSSSEYIPLNENAISAQYIFITDNKELLGEKNKLIFNDKYSNTYMNAHKKYHQDFNTFLTNYELYDIFMVDLQGNVIYTDFKEKDFATNLKTGIYANTGLAKAYSKALNLEDGKIAFDDFRPYEPSYNQAAAFISTPIFNGKERIGVMIFQMPIGIINKIMQFNGHEKEAGLGDSGEAYLVGSDYKMRSNSRFFKDIENENVQAQKTTVGIFEVKTESTKASIQNKKTGENIISDYRGTSVISSYIPINVYGEEWAIIVEIDEDEALSVLYTMRITILTIILIISVMVIIFSLIFINKIITKPLTQFSILFKEFVELILFKRNIASARITSTTNDEFGVMINEINKASFEFQDKLKADMKVMGELTITLDKVKRGFSNDKVISLTKDPMVTTLKNTINNMLLSLNGNMEQIESTLSTYTNNDFRTKITIPSYIQGRMRNIMENVNALGDALALSAKENLENGNILEINSNDMKNSMNNLASKANEQAASLEETAAAIEEITSITRNNSESYSKMQTLGLTVRKAVTNGQNLALNTTIAMDEINSKVTAINEAITVIDQIAFQTNILSLNAAVEAATAGEAGRGFAVVAAEVRNLANRSAEAAKEIKVLVQDATEKANSGKNISDEMIKGYHELNMKITETIHIIDEVSTSSKEQITGIEQINNTINMLDQVTQENASEANRITSIADDVSTLAYELVAQAKTKQF